MCRGKKQCAVLGVDSSLWSNRTPLQPPAWFSDELEKFEKAFKLAQQNKLKESLDILLKIRNEDLRNWYVEHGQLSGRFRNRLLEVITFRKENVILDELRSPDKYRKQVLKRDDFTCQYCGGKVIPKEIFTKFEKLVGEKNFKATGTNAQRHGVVLAFRANADHIFPWSHGGKTNIDNLISSCWSCNYGKSGYTLEEIDIRNPKNNNYSNNGWNGLLDC